MSRARSAAALLAAVAAIVPASVAVGAGRPIDVNGIPSLSPRPPVALPAHPPAAHHRRHAAHTPLPNTGLDVADELLAASVLLAGGAGVRAGLRRRHTRV
jgi:hypothetical protein